jgi:group I intron endonuclease
MPAICGVVYLVRNLMNRKVYVGQTINTAAVRWQSHVSASRGSKARPGSLAAAIREYGQWVFSVEVLATASEQHELDELETMFVDKYKSFDPAYGYNRSSDGKYRPSRESVSRSVTQ